MGLGNPTGGFAYAAEFQSSALPWVTSSVASNTPQEWDFNYASRFLTFVNQSSSGSFSFGFTLNGINGSNKVIVPASGVVTVEVRCTKVWVKNDSGSPPYSLLAGLTTIPAGQFPVLSGSFPDGTAWAGVG